MNRRLEPAVPCWVVVASTARLQGSLSTSCPAPAAVHRDVQTAGAPLSQRGKRQLCQLYHMVFTSKAHLVQRCCQCRPHLPLISPSTTPLPCPPLQLAVVTRALARWYLVLVQWVVTFLHWTGLLRLEGDSNGPTTAASSARGSGTAEPEAVHRTARQVVQDTVRGGLRATARAAQMHHRGLPDETLAAIERACEQATQVGMAVGRVALLSANLLQTPHCGCVWTHCRCL